MEIKILAKNTAILASPKIVKFLVGIIRSKFIAVFLGTVGTGIINQLQSLINQFATFTLSSMPDGMVKLIAKQNSLQNDKQIICDIIKTFLSLLIPIAILVTVLGYLFSSQITIFVFGDLKYLLYFQIGFAALPISILNSTAFALLKGYKEIKTMAISDITIIIINILLFLPLIYFMGIMGGVIYVLLTYCVTFIIFRHFTYRKVLKPNSISMIDIMKAKFTISHFKELISFMGFGIIVGSYTIFVEISTRSIVVNELGIDKIGVYSPIVSWATLFIGFILPSLRTYLFPRISEAKNDKDITNVVNDVIRLMTFVTLPFIFIGISLREYLIPIFYSSAFAGASLYLPYHFASLVFVIWTYSFVQIFGPTDRLKYLLFFSLFHHSIRLALVYFLISDYGLYAYMAKYAVTPIISTIVYFVFFSKAINFKIQTQNIKLIIFSITSLFIILMIKDEQIYLIITTIIFLSFMVFLLNKSERNYMLKKVFKK